MSWVSDFSPESCPSGSFVSQINSQGRDSWNDLVSPPRRRRHYENGHCRLSCPICPFVYIISRERHVWGQGGRRTGGIVYVDTCVFWLHDVYWGIGSVWYGSACVRHARVWLESSRCVFVCIAECMTMYVWPRSGYECIVGRDFLCLGGGKSGWGKGKEKRICCVEVVRGRVVARVCIYIRIKQLLPCYPAVPQSWLNHIVYN